MGKRMPETAEEMLNEMGTIGVWENLTETVDKANKYTDTTSEIYADFRPKEYRIITMIYDNNFFK